MTPDRHNIEITQLDDAERRYQEEVADILDHHKAITSEGYAGRQDLIDEYCTEFNDMSRTIKDQKDIISALESGVDIAAGLQKKVDSLDEHAGVKDTVIALAMKRIAEQKTTLTERHNRISTLHGLIRGLEAKIESIRNGWLLSCNDVHAIEAELLTRKDDSKVLMTVVKIVDMCWKNKIVPVTAMTQLKEVLEDYIDAPEGPPETSVDEQKKPTAMFVFTETKQEE